MFMGILLDDALEPLVRDTFLVPTQLLGRSAEQGASAPLRRPPLRRRRDVMVAGKTSGEFAIEGHQSSGDVLFDVRDRDPKTCGEIVIGRAVEQMGEEDRTGIARQCVERLAIALLEAGPALPDPVSAKPISP
jgi:hypothetical protein